MKEFLSKRAIRIRSALAIPVLVLLLFALTVSAPVAAGGAPKLGQPVIHLFDGTECQAGKAFAVAWFAGRKLLVSPLHLLGPAGGLSAYIEPAEIPTKLRELEVLDPSSGRKLLSVSKSLLKTGIPVEKGRGDVSEDLMAFEIEGNCPLHVFALSNKLPSVGLHVKVISRERESNSGVREFRGVVSQSSNTGLVVRMDDFFETGASSGAPVVDDRDNLVGMMVGHQSDELIVAIPVNRIYGRIFKEIGAKGH